MGTKELISILEESLRMVINYPLNPEKRIYIGYLFTSVLMAYYVYKKSKSKKSFWVYLMPKKVWLSFSASTDFIFIVFNSFVKIIFIAPCLIVGLYLAYYVNEYLMRRFGVHTFEMNTFLLTVIYTFVLTLFSDFTSYLVHYAQHKIPFLWEFHKVHHSATELNPLTQYRIHPVELLLNNLKTLVIIGLTAGIFDYFSDAKMDKLTFLSVNIFSFLFLAFGANLRHTHIRFTYFDTLEYIFISPFQHQIHHSSNAKHFDKNMGAKLAIWDWIFGTLVRSKEVENISFGLGKEDSTYDSFWKNLYKPFTNNYKRIISLFH